MEELKRFDVDVAVSGGITMVVVESDLLPPAPAVVVIPLLPDYPAVTLLNPVLPFAGQDLVLATRLITSVRRSAIARAGSVAEHADRITRAIDILTGGL